MSLTYEPSSEPLQVDGRPQFAGSGVWEAGSTMWSFSLLAHFADLGQPPSVTSSQGATPFTYWVQLSLTPACGVAAQRVDPQPSTLNPQLSTLNPQPSTLNPQPSNLNPQPSTLRA